MGSFRRHRGRVFLAGLTVLALVAVILAVRSLESPSSPATAQIVRPLSETPGSSNAVLFSTASDPSADFRFVRAQLELHHYSVDEFTNGNGKATAANFKSVLMERRGILFAAGEGALGFLAVQTLTDAAGCAQAVTGYVASGVFKAGDIVCHDRLLGITSPGLSGAFRDSETIVYVSACDSASMQAAFANARDFVGYKSCAGNAVPTLSDRKFWGRLAGTADSGRARSTMVAAGKHDYGSAWTFHHRPKTPDTVLSPSVTQILPAPGSIQRVAGSTGGRVVFDTRMDQNTPAADIVSMTGCEATITNPHWLTTANGYSAVDFTLQMNSPGIAVVTIPATSARAARDFQNILDGNQDPPRSDGVGPNGDAYVWTFDCIPGNGPPLPSTSQAGPVATTTPLPVASVTTTTSGPGTGGGGGTGGTGGAGGGGAGGGGGGGTGGGGGGGGGGGTGGTTVPGGGGGGGPTCSVSAFRDTPAPATQTATVQSSAGLASISGIQVNNGTVSVQAFAVGTRSPVSVTATKLDQTRPTQWSFSATDVSGRTTRCQ
ncbi:MAG: hypothetical protein QOJ52_2547 [Acidimicrobiaceae bacterium]|nr:hypothetical protein [Acidimicrobiaceae bacterium]